MKTLIFCTILALFLISSKKEQNGYTEHNLKGKVKSIYESFDFDRQRISEHWPDSGKESIELIYDAKGYVARETHFNYKSHDSINDVMYYIYDSNGNKIEYHWLDGNSERYNFRYENDAHGRRIASIQYDSLKRILRREEYKYDSMGNKIETNVFKPDGSPNGKSINKYDNRNNKIETCTYGNNGKLRERLNYDYDNDGNIIEQKHFNVDGIMNEDILIKYDAQGNSIEETGAMPIENSVWKCKMAYDTNNNTTKRDCSYSDPEKDKMQTYKYEYDDIGNWIKESVFDNDSLAAMFSREITYY